MAVIEQDNINEELLDLLLHAEVDVNVAKVSAHTGPDW